MISKWLFASTNSGCIKGVSDAHYQSDTKFKIGRAVSVEQYLCTVARRKFTVYW